MVAFLASTQPAKCWGQTDAVTLKISIVAAHSTGSDEHAGRVDTAAKSFYRSELLVAVLSSTYCHFAADITANITGAYWRSNVKINTVAAYSTGSEQEIRYSAGSIQRSIASL